MRIRVVPVDFHREGGLVLPRESQVFQAAQEFCGKYLTERPNLALLQKVWLAASVDQQGGLIEPLAIAGYRTVVDVPLFRSVHPKATLKIGERMNGFFADQGCRGQEVFIYISSTEQPEQRCPQYESSLSAFGAKAADRHAIVIA